MTKQRKFQVTVIAVILLLVIGTFVGLGVRRHQIIKRQAAAEASSIKASNRRTSMSESRAISASKSESRASSASEQSLKDHSVTGEEMTQSPESMYDETFKLLGTRAFEDCQAENVGDYGLTASSFVKDGDQWYWLFQLTGSGQYYTVHKDPVKAMWVVGAVADKTMQFDLEDAKTGKDYSIVFKGQYQQNGGNNYELIYQGITHQFLVHASASGVPAEHPEVNGAYYSTFDSDALNYIATKKKSENAAYASSSAKQSSYASSRKAADEANGISHDTFGDDGYTGVDVSNPFATQ